MAMSRTARILIAILLLAAAAFFWVNFYTQSRTAETPPVTDPVSAAGAPEPAASEPAAQDPAASEPAAQDPAASEPAAQDPAASEPAASEPSAQEPAASDSDGVDAGVEPAAIPDGVAAESPAPADGEDAPATEADADAPLVVAPVTDDPPTVVVDAPVSVGREIVIADLPFLVTEPRPVDDPSADALDLEADAFQGVTTPTRATVNPFSPVVVRTPPAPERDVPDAPSVVGEVEVPAGPTPAEIAAAEEAARASAPTPRAVTPGSASDTAALRPLPSGAVLSSTPELLRETRVGTVAEEVDFATVTTIAVPDAEPAELEPTEPSTAQAGAPDEIEPRATASVQPDETASDSGAEPGAESDAEAGTETDPEAGDVTQEPPVVNGAPPPLAAGATQLARFLRDQNYSFTGSVVGPVGVGVFRSDLDAAPVVVALGQTLPDTEIVLTDLRGQQAELRLGDTTQILTLDLRR